jgi:hypothetical protein
MYKCKGGVKMKTRRSVTLTVLVDLKVGEKADIKNIIERLECRCSDMSGEDVEITNVQIMDRQLLLEVAEED